MNDQQLPLPLYGPGLGGVEYAVKAAMREAAAGSGLTRPEIVARMEELAGRHGVKITSGSAPRLSEAVLEKWLNPQDGERVIPLKALPIYCRVVGSLAPLRELAGCLGAEVIDGEDLVLLGIARSQEKIRKEQRRLRQLKERLG